MKIVGSRGEEVNMVSEIKLCVCFVNKSINFPDEIPHIMACQSHITT